MALARLLGMLKELAFEPFNIKPNQP